MSRLSGQLRGEAVLRWMVIGALLLFVGAVINVLMGGPFSGPVMIVAVVLPFALVRLAAEVFRDRVDVRIESLLKRQIRGLKVVTHEFPDYRFVDVFRAIEEYFANVRMTILESHHSESLGLIVSGTFYSGSGAVKVPPHSAFQVGPTEEAFFPKERFWIRRPEGEKQRHLVVRVRHDEATSVAVLEVASGDLGYAGHILSEIRDMAAALSIYRGRAVEVSFAVGVKDELGNVDQGGRMKVAFHKASPLNINDIVIDDRLWPVLEHSLISLHKNREQLQKFGVALKRGFLFYGPPGTGKSFTARYLATVLSGATAIYCSGTALHHVASAFNLARLLKPAIIVLEDVDLVFASRDINPFGGALGDLFDQIDAIGDREPICIVLTTNAIERVEAAVKDRPGRVSQCVYFGPPSADLRRRYLRSYLGPNEMAEADVQHVVKETDGVTQAFLKELVHRGLQFAVEAGRISGDSLTPIAQDFDAALAEMRAFDSKAARAITGFRP